MHLKTRNVNTAFHDLVRIFNDPETGPGMCEYPDLYENTVVVRKESRNGPVLMMEEPVIVTYKKPLERVLFSPSRDANPFFHLYESLWMLAGREDVAPLAFYTKQMAEYSDNGDTLNGAYGYRWRRADTSVGMRDQLDILVEHLTLLPSSRRAVLQMWNVKDDLMNISDVDTGMMADGFQASSKRGFHKLMKFASKDVCCNLSVMFSIRTVNIAPYPGTPEPLPLPDRVSYLDMTVTNRSNDLVWGMLGANYVHFSFLQEYMAARLGVKVGVYNHMTNNLHVYESNWKPSEWLKNAHVPNYGYHVGAGATHESIFPLVKNPQIFEQELPLFVQKFSGSGDASVYSKTSSLMWQEPFFAQVAEPMLMAFQCYRAWKLAPEKNVEGMLVARDWAKQIKADDWKHVATEWLQRRTK